MKIPRSYIALYLFDAIRLTAIISLIGFLLLRIFGVSKTSLILIMPFWIGFLSPGMVGGGLAYYFISAIFIGLHVLYFKKLLKPFALLATIIFSIGIFNYISQYEKLNGLSIPVLITTIVIIYIIGQCLINIVHFPIILNTRYEYEEENNLRKYVRYKFVGHSRILSPSLTFITGGFLYLTSKSNHLPRLIENKEIGLTTFAPLCLFIGMLYEHYEMKKIPTNYLKHFLNKDTTEDTNRLIKESRNWIMMPVWGSFIMGIFLELLLRGNWSAFLLSSVMLFACIAKIFSIWKHIISDKDKEDDKIDFSKVPRADDMMLLIKPPLIATALTVTWGILLVAFFVMTG